MGCQLAPRGCDVLVGARYQGSMFGDRWRFGELVLVLLLTVALGRAYTSFAQTQLLGYARCAAEPETYDGARLVFPLWQVTRIDGPDRYAVSKVLKDVPVAGPTEGLRLGETLSIEGRFEAEGALVIEQLREHHPLRDAKKALSLVGAILALVWVPRWFTVRGGRVVERA